MSRFLSICHPIAALAAIGIAAAAPASDVLTASPEHVATGRDLNARLTVPVTINGGGPYDFVVDTGAERTVISRELANRLTLAPSGQVTLLTIGGSDRVDTAMVRDLKLTAGRSRLVDLQAPVLSELHLGAVGMIGIDSLQRKRVIVDFRAKRMTISEAPRVTHAEADEIIVIAKRRYGQLILVDAEAEGQSINVVIDTGSAVTIANDALRQRLVRRGRLGLMVPIMITSVTGIQTPAHYTALRRIRIGGVNLDDMPIAFADTQIFHRLGLDRKPALLLGMDALRLFDRVSIDFANRNVRFLMPGDAFNAAPPQLAAIVPLRS